MIKIAVMAMSSATVAIGAMLGGEAPTDSAAYGGELKQLYQNQYLDHSESLFARADLDQDGYLDNNEFTSLALVRTELARLNGFVAVHQEPSVKRLSLPVDANSQAVALLDKNDRVRVNAVSQQQYYAFAGADQMMNWSEYSQFAIEFFASADANADGVLRRNELLALARQEAHIQSPDV